MSTMKSRRNDIAFISATPLFAPEFLSRNSHLLKFPAKPTTPSHQCHPIPKSVRHRHVLVPKLALSLPFSPPPATVALITTAASAATPFTLWTVLIIAATLGMTSQRYRWGQALTPPLVATLFTLILSNFELLPVVHPIYSAVTTFIVPLSVPLILLGADLRRVVAQTGRLLPVYIIGSIATCVGTLVAWYLVPIKAALGSSAWKIAAALTARHIGGAVNYVAVADATAAPAEIVTAALTADNVVVAIYFVFLLLLARNVSQPSVESSPSATTVTTTVDMQNGDIESKVDSDDDVSGPIDITNAAVALSISAILCTLAAFIASLIPIRLGIIPIVTALVVILATAIPNQLQPYRRAASILGIFFLQIFFAVAGAGGSIMSVMRRAPVLLVFSTVQILTHLACLMVVGRIFGSHKAHIFLASNANIGGPATAAAMARAKSWDTLVLPALLVGVLGYSIATFISLGLGVGVLRFL